MNTKPSIQEISDEDKEFLRFIVKPSIAVFSFSAIVVAFYIFWFWKRPISQETESWGQFGDYIGGLINPFVGIVTVVLVIYSIRMQRRELKASLAEMKYANTSAEKMRFEQTLFSWLSSYHELLREIKTGNYQGRQALVNIFHCNLSMRNQLIKQKNPVNKKDDVINGCILWGFKNWKAGETCDDELGNLGFLVSARKSVLEKYEEFYKNNRSNLKFFLNPLQKMFQWIDSSEVLTEDEKNHYFTIVLSQISWSELALIFYYCLGAEGKNFSIIANKYSIFESLYDDRDLLVKILKEEIINKLLKDTILNESAFNKFRGDKEKSYN